MFPARSSFTPGWVYVHVGGGAVSLISLKYWALVLLEFVVCTALVDLTVRTLYDCVGNAICYYMYHYLFEKARCIVFRFFTGIMAAYHLPNLECIYPTDGPRIYPMVFWYYTVVCRVLFLTVCSCFLLCTATVHRNTFVTLLIEFLVHFVTPIQ